MRPVLLLVLLLCPQSALQTLNQPRVYLAIQPGSDFCSELVDALNQAGNKNAYIDLRGVTGTQSCSTNPLAGLVNIPSSIVIQMPCARINTTAGWLIPHTTDVRIVGCGKQGNSVLAAASGFPANTALLTEGVPGTISSSVMVQDWRLDCSGSVNAGCQPFQAFGINEHSGAQDVVMIGQNSSAATTPCATIGDTSQTGLPGHYIFFDVDMSRCGANDGLYVHADGASLPHIERITCNNTGFVTGLACVHFFDDFGGSHTLESLAKEIHAEGFTDSVYFDAASFGRAEDVDGTGVMSNILHISSTSPVEAFNLHASGPGVNIVNNTNAQCSGTCLIPGSAALWVGSYLQLNASGLKNTSIAQY